MRPLRSSRMATSPTSSWCRSRSSALRSHGSTETEKPRAEAGLLHTGGGRGERWSGSKRRRQVAAMQENPPLRRLEQDRRDAYSGRTAGKASRRSKHFLPLQDEGPARRPTPARDFFELFTCAWLAGPSAARRLQPTANGPRAPDALRTLTGRRV